MGVFDSGQSDVDNCCFFTVSRFVFSSRLGFSRASTCDCGIKGGRSRGYFFASQPGNANFVLAKMPYSAARKLVRPKSPKLGRRLIVRLARENGWGYTRIPGDLKKLGRRRPSRWMLEQAQAFHQHVKQTGLGAKIVIPVGYCPTVGVLHHRDRPAEYCPHRNRKFTQLVPAKSGVAFAIDGPQFMRVHAP